MRPRSAASDLQAALQRDREAAADRQARQTAHFLRFTDCLRRRAVIIPNQKA